MILIIAEKKELASAIAAALPGEEKTLGSFIAKGNYVVSYLGGHAMELKDPEEIDGRYKVWKKEDLPIYFYPWPKKVKLEKMGLVTQIRQHIKAAEYVIHAGDNDDEGQLLVDEIIEYLGYKGKVLRLDCGNTTKAGLKKAFERMTDNKEHVRAGLAAYARAVSDKTFGYSLTRHFSLINDIKLNVGRVKTPTLGLVVNRDRLIESHKKITFYDLFAKVDISGKITLLKLQQDGLCQDKKALEEKIKRLIGKSCEITVIKKEQKEEPPLPFNLVKLQTFCGSAFACSPEKVMQITQRLRDEYKAITYNRSDCQYLTEDHFKEAPETVRATLDNLGMAEEEMDIDTSRKSKAFNDKYVTLHFAIIPSGERVDLALMTEEERNVYTAIANRYLAQFARPCKKIVTEAICRTGEGDFKASAAKIIDQGYREFAKNRPEEKIEPLNDIPQGRYRSIFSDIQIKEGETKPPKRYTESTLNEDLTRIARYVTDEKIKKLLLQKDDGKKGENGSIGTVATRSKIIADLIKDGYLKKEGKNIISTRLGREFYEALPGEIKKADTTALWWIHQEAITEGKEPPTALTESVLKTIEHVIRNYTQRTFNESKESIENEVVGRCPLCGRNVVSVENKKLRAYVCSNKECKFIIWKNAFGGHINVANVKRLLEGRETMTIKMKSKKGNEFKGKLRLNKDGSLELLFINKGREKNV